MSRRWAGLLVALTVGALILPAAAVGDQQADLSQPDGSLSVGLDETRIEVGPGQKVRFTSTVRNAGDHDVGRLVAHVAILTSDSDVYVDPEDWSPRRTQYVDRLAAGEDATLTWNVQAVTAGPLILYVAVTDLESDTVAVSGPLYMSVTGQREVNSQDAVPLVLGVPVVVLLLLGVTGIRRRTRR